MKKNLILFVGRDLRHAENSAFKFMQAIGERFIMENNCKFSTDNLTVILKSLKSIEYIRGYAADKMFIPKETTEEQFEIIKWSVRGPSDIYTLGD